MKRDKRHQIVAMPRGVVLIVDDESVIIDFIKRVLAKEPYHLITASSGLEALKILEQEPIDVIVTDLMMPGMTGIELLQKARALHPISIQSIVFSACGAMESAIQAMRMGATDYLKKPFTNANLKASIAAAITRAQEIKDVQQRICDTKESSLSIFENVLAGIILIDDSTHVIVEINPAACKMIGSPKAELVGQICHQTICASGKEGCPIDSKQTLRNAAHYLKTRIGTIRPVIKSVSKIQSEGKVLRLETFLDLSEQEQLRKDLEASKSTFHSIVEKSLDGILIIDDQGVTRFANNAAAKLFTTTKAEMLGQEFGFPLTTTESTELDIVQHNTSSLTAEMRVAETEWCGKNAYIATLRDVSERKLVEAYIQTLAHHDQLTGLPNRRLLLDRLSISLNNARRHSGQLAILYMDLDAFKPINDIFGHDTGDLVLQVVASRLQETVRGSDTVARVGGDEFIMVLHEVKSNEGIASLAQKIVDIINQPIQINNQTHQVKCSLGISIYPKDGKNHFELIKNADSAMYNVKNEGKNNFAFFNNQNNNA